MYRQLTEKEIEGLYPFIEESLGFDAPTNVLLPEQRYDSVTSAFARVQVVGLQGSGVFGYFETDELKLICAVFPWRPLKYYSIRSIYGKTGKWQAVTGLIEACVEWMEGNGYYTFFWARPVVPALKTRLQTRLFLCNLPERYDVVVESYRDMGRCETFDTFAEAKDTAVFRASLKNEFRPYQADGPSFEE